MDVMDIANLSMGMAQSRTVSDVGTAMLAKSLDTMEMAGDQLMKMIASVPASHAAELSVNPDIGANIDIYA